MKRRERARRIALQALYQMDVRGEEFGPETVAFLRDSTRDPQVYFFARRLAEGAWPWRRHGDLLIEEAAEHWRVARMAAVDRNILRLATWEICQAPDIPVRVSIDQAIELAKAFSAAEAAAFVNGVLDRVLRLARERGLVAGGEGESASDEEASSSAAADDVRDDV
jgi:N utilization substance protein B